MCSVGSEIYKLQAAFLGCLTLTLDHTKRHDIKVLLSNSAMSCINESTRPYNIIEIIHF